MPFIACYIEYLASARPGGEWYARLDAIYSSIGRFAPGVLIVRNVREDHGVTTPDATSDLYAGYPDGFFLRSDEQPDQSFYGPPRLVTHIDDEAIEAVGAVYTELGLSGRVLDLMSSWVSHFETTPDHLTILGMNASELSANEQAAETVIHDLNQDPTLPFEDSTFDGAVCCVSVDYLIKPVEVFVEVVRALKPGGVFACTFSNRCFPTKAIQGWLAADDAGHCAIVTDYFRRSAGWEEPTVKRCTPEHHFGDPLYAVWARKLA